jgi:hypothetical protein
MKVKKGTQIGVVVSTGMDAGDLKIPDLIGKNVEEAKKLILQNKFTLGKINFQPSTSVPVNAVIDQYPKANTMAKENQRIDLFVNKVVKEKIPVEEEEMEPPGGTDKEKENIDKEEKSKDKDELKKETKPKPTDKKEEKKPEKKEEKKTEKKKT